MYVCVCVCVLCVSNQRRATKREAVELDNEIESQLNAAQTTLHIQVLKKHIKHIKKKCGPFSIFIYFLSMHSSTENFILFCLGDQIQFSLKE